MRAVQLASGAVRGGPSDERSQFANLGRGSLNENLIFISLEPVWPLTRTTVSFAWPDVRRCVHLSPWSRNGPDRQTFESLAIQNRHGDKVRGTLIPVFEALGSFARGHRSRHACCDLTLRANFFHSRTRAERDTACDLMTFSAKEVRARHTPPRQLSFVGRS